MTRDMRALVRDGYERDGYAAAFRTNPEPTAFEARFLEQLCQGLPAGAHILDLGAGVGEPYDRWLVNRGYRLTGVDFSSKHVRLARQNVPQAMYIEADFSRLEFAPASFEAVVCFYAIFHLPRAEQPALFGKIYDWLKPGGLLLATLGHSDEEYGEEADWLGAPMAWSSFAPETYRRMLEELDFAILSGDYDGAPGDAEYHYWLLAEKVQAVNH
jgi:SAM-dependent methyltransferase